MEKIILLIFILLNSFAMPQKQIQPIIGIGVGPMGIAGFHSWDGYDHSTENGFDQQNLWTSTIRAQQHMNGDDVINTLNNNNGNWAQGREYIIDLKREHQYYVSNDQNKAVGFVRNRTFNVYTEAVLNGNITSSCVTNNSGINVNFKSAQSLSSGSGNYILDIEGLKKKYWYQIDYYSFKDGNFMVSQCDQSDNKGQLFLLHPILTYPFPLGNSSEINPIVWYVIKESECNKMDEIESNKLVDSTFYNDLIIFPNPTSDKIVIQSDDTIGNVIILDIYGKQLIKTKSDLNIETIDLSNLDSGVYLIHLINLNKSYSIIKY